MIFNKKTGALTLDELNIDSDLTIDTIKKISIKKKLSIFVENGDWISYNLIINKEKGITFQFFQNKITSFNIYLNEISNPNPEYSLIKLCKNFGGENKYAWGKVELILNDHKSGDSSIRISYNVKPQ